MLNTKGFLTHAPHVIQALLHTDLQDVLIFTETHHLPASTPPTLQGYSLICAVPGTPDRGVRGRGGVAIYVRSPLVGRVQRWRCREGVAWIRMRGRGGRQLYVAGCYLPPQQSSEQQTAFFGKLQQDTLAAQTAGGLLCIGGDFNGRTASLPDWVACTAGAAQLAEPCDRQLRASCDMVVNPQGQALLAFCSATDLAVANGRLSGDTHGEWTFHSLANYGKSVVDYFLLSAELLACAGNSLTVHAPADRLDHADLCLHLQFALGTASEVLAPGSTNEAQPNPCGQEYRILSALLPAFVEAVEDADAALQATAELAEGATTVSDLGAACQRFNDLVCECLEAAGMPVLRRGDSRQPGWQRRVTRDPTTSRLQRQRRRALRKRDFAQATALNRQICAAARRQKRRLKQLRGKELAKLARTDPAAFYKRLRGKTQGPDPSITSDAWNAHFDALLGQESASPAAPPSRVGREPEAAELSLSMAAPLDTSDSQAALELARQQLHAPFSSSELCTVAARMKNGKAVLGALKPVLLKAALQQLAPTLVALMNACVRFGCMPAVWAVSALTPVRKPDSDPLRCDGYRGIAVGTLPAKLYASMLNDRVVSFTEAAGIRASGQAGFRKSYGCSDQQLALRAIIERQRARGRRLFVCYVDFKQAFDRVPRHLLWHKLERIGLTGWALQAVQALYADVSMCVSLPAGFTRLFQARSGVKQGCPLSPTLFGLYLDDFEEGLLCHAEAAALPRWQNGRAVPPLFYADDQALLAVTAAGLRHQLAYLERYCETWGLTVNIKKTKIVVYTTSHSPTDEQFRYDSTPVETVPEFRYLGVHLHSTHAFASAATFRAQAGRRAMHLLRRRLAENGLCCPILSMRLFKTYVLPVLSYGAEVWGPQLVTQGQSACEKVHYEFLRGLLGVRDSTPKMTLLAETGQLPLAAHWTKQIARFVNRLKGMEDSRIARQAFLDSIDLATGTVALPMAKQPWAAQVKQALAAAGVTGNLLSGETIDIEELSEELLYRHVASYANASPKVARYVTEVLGGTIETATYVPAEYLVQVPQRCRRQRLAQVRTGSHWLAEETGRWQRRARDQRPCPHCQGPLEDAGHMVFDCPLYGELREQFSDLFHPATPPEGTAGTAHTLAGFLGQADQTGVARFVHQCHAAHIETQ